MNNPVLLDDRKGTGWGLSLNGRSIEKHLFYQKSYYFL